MYTSAHGDVDLRPSDATGWTGWVVFGAIMMIVSGTFDVIWGIVGLVRDQVFVVGPQGNLISLDYTTWGVINLIVGAVVVFAGVALFTASMFARVLAIIVAVLSAVENLLVIGAYPVWSTIIIALDVLVIYAVAVHGHELRSY
jgi:hypothetical protein